MFKDSLVMAERAVVALPVSKNEQLSHREVEYLVIGGKCVQYNGTKEMTFNTYHKTPILA